MSESSAAAAAASISTSTTVTATTRRSSRTASKLAIERIHSLHVEESKGEIHGEDEDVEMTPAAAVTVTDSHQQIKNKRPTDDGHTDTSPIQPPLKRIKRSQPRDEEVESDDMDEGSEEEEEEKDESADSEKDSLSDESESEEEEVIEETKEMDESDSDYEAGRKKKRKRLKETKKKKKTKKSNCRDKEGESEVLPSYPLVLHTGKKLGVSYSYLLDEARSTGEAALEAAALGLLVGLRDPPIDINLISPRYHDSIAFTIVRIMADHGIRDRLMKPIRKHYDWLMQHIKDTIDPTIVNSMVRTDNLTLSECVYPTTYPRKRWGRWHNNPKFTDQIKKILIERGGVEQWLQPDNDGRMALFNPALDASRSVSDTFQLLFPSVKDFKKVMKVLDGKGNTVLHSIFRTPPEIRVRHESSRQQRYLELIELFMTKPDYFKHLDLNMVNNDGETLLDLVDQAATPTHQRLLQKKDYRWRNIECRDVAKAFSAPKRVREMWSKASTSASKLNDQLSKYLIPDLYHIVTDYLFYCEPPLMLCFGYSYEKYGPGHGYTYDKVAVPSDCTIGELKQHLQSTHRFPTNPHANYKLIIVHKVEVSRYTIRVLGGSIHSEDYELTQDDDRRLVDEGVIQDCVIKLQILPSQPGELDEPDDEWDLFIDPL